MPAWFLATMLIAAAQDVSTLKIPPPPRATELDGPPSPSWTRVRAEPIVACPKPPHGEIVPYDRLPAEVMMDLRRTDPRMSPPGGPFSATDAWDGVSPFTRIIAAMRNGGRLAVAYERGGRGYGITLLTYDADARTGLLAVSGVHPLVPGRTAQGWRNGEAACDALREALKA